MYPATQILSFYSISKCEKASSFDLHTYSHQRVVKTRKSLHSELVSAAQKKGRCLISACKNPKHFRYVPPLALKNKNTHPMLLNEPCSNTQHRASVILLLGLFVSSRQTAVQCSHGRQRAEVCLHYGLVHLPYGKDTLKHISWRQQTHRLHGTKCSDLAPLYVIGNFEAKSKRHEWSHTSA